MLISRRFRSAILPIFVHAEKESAARHSMQIANTNAKNESPTLSQSVERSGWCGPGPASLYLSIRVWHAADYSAFLLSSVPAFISFPLASFFLLEPVQYN